MTAKGKKVLASMRKTYGADAERVLHASINAGKVTGIFKGKKH